MQCLRISSPIFPATPLFSPPPKHSRACSFKPYTPASSRIRMSASAQVIEHIVLFKVKEGTDPSKVNAMVNGLNALVSLDQVLHLTAGPVLRTGSPSLSFTHMLHSRYGSKDDLGAYTAHPEHMRVVKESVFPICEDLMAVDWVAEGLDLSSSALALAPGSALKVSFLKLKESSGEDVKKEVLGVIKGIKESLSPIEQVSYGENFSPARAKGFSIASLAVFKTEGELAAVDSEKELVSTHKDKVGDYLDGVLVVDYVIA